MKTLEFEDEQGNRIERLCREPLESVEHEGRTFRRVEVPSRMNIGTGAEPMSVREEIRRGCHELETNGKPWRVGYSKDTVKKVWGL